MKLTSFFMNSDKDICTKVCTLMANASWTKHSVYSIHSSSSDKKVVVIWRPLMSVSLHFFWVAKTIMNQYHPHVKLAPVRVFSCKLPLNQPNVVAQQKSDSIIVFFREWREIWQHTFFLTSLYNIGGLKGH